MRFASPLQALAGGVISPQPYATVGLLYCGIKTNQAGSYSVVFTVANKAGARVAVQRTVVVQPGCEDGELRCNDGTCGEGGGGWVAYVLGPPYP